MILVLDNSLQIFKVESKPTLSKVIVLINTKIANIMMRMLNQSRHKNFL